MMQFAVCMVWAFSLTLSSLLVTSINGTGLKLLEPPPGSKSVCSALESHLIFRCTTTGKGDTLLSFIFERISVPEFRFRHSLYTPTTPYQNENQTRLDNEIRAGNLLRSDSMDCFDTLRNMSDYCYTTSLVILPTSGTLCGVVVCRTVFNNGTGDQPYNFGRAVIARTPPQPTNLRVMIISPESVTLVWEAGTSTDCSKITYEVTTNCGSCSPTMMTMDSNITCNDLVAGQMCNVSVRSMLECGMLSDPRTMEVLIPEATTTIKDNSRIALGVGLGVSLSFACAILIIGVVVGALVFKKKSAKSTRYDVRQMREIIPTIDNPETAKDSEGENGAGNTLTDDTKAIAKDHAGDISVDRQQLLSEEEISLNETNEPDEKQTSGTNAVVAPVQKQTSSIVAMESEEVVDSKKVGGVSTDTFQPSLQSTEESTVKEKSVTFVKTVAVPCQQEDTGAATSRDMPVTMLPLSVQAFSSSTENGKQSTSSIVSQGDSVNLDNRHEMAPKQNNMTEGGRPVSQDSELTLKDKKPVILSDNEDGPAQAVAIKGAQNFTNVNVAGSCPVADMLNERLSNLEAKNEERFSNLEANLDAYRLDSNTKIDTLNAQIASLEEKLEAMRIDYAELEKKSEEERQRHEEEEERLKKEIEQLKEKLAAETERAEKENKTNKQLREELAAEKERAEKLEKENKTMPRKALSTEMNNLDNRPQYQRTKSCPAQTQ